jgi:acyl dehydratase
VSALAIDAVAVGDALPEIRRTVTRGDLLAYAEASGDRNPLHRDDDIARAAGFPGVIAHGMFTMGVLAGCVAAWAGDHAAIRRLGAQFRAPVFLGEEIVAGGRVRAVDRDRSVAVLETWVTVERDGSSEWPIRRGAAEVSLEPASAREAG